MHKSHEEHHKRHHHILSAGFDVRPSFCITISAPLITVLKTHHYAKVHQCPMSAAHREENILKKHGGKCHRFLLQLNIYLEEVLTTVLLVARKKVLYVKNQDYNIWELTALPQTQPLTN